jgi:hypothetical protein
MQPIVGDINHVIRTAFALRDGWCETPWRAVFPEIYGLYDFADQEDLRSKLFMHRLTNPPMMQFSNGLHSTGLLDAVQNGSYCTSAFLRNSIESLISGAGIQGDGDYLPDAFPTREYSERLPSILASNLVEIDW